MIKPGTFVPTPHPILPIPTPDQMQKMGMAEWARLMTEREKLIRAERDDPIRYQFEPASWKLTDLLMDFPWVDKTRAASVRARLGFPTPVKVMLINGGNRAAKSRYAARTAMRLLNEPADGGKDAEAWVFHENNQNSVDYHQKLMWELLPKELRKTVRTQKAYISFTQKYGFSDNKFVLPNGAVASFRNYEQDIRSIEGGEINFGWCDENVPPEWIETLELRVATRDGWILATYTPIWGYGGTVKLFLDGARTVLESVAWLLPRRDGVVVDERMVLAREEMKELVA